ncbi:hypothetical protein LL295_06495 [Vibrio campbellii]|uniref:hypothetical protein n=2 Tax=Vibrio campbellii TaxID=680 RepID=UPI000CD3324E|nr:hypothetical protein [Vibrio campbellii]AUV88084.1 hypothetical protein C1N50_18105 [Vibrio campbellii]MCC4223161.1 hypothetical protein [Vibrio campbellii]PQJ43508.1 hypothetical protein BTO00_16145 [Vibrio campbellii]
MKMNKKILTALIIAVAPLSSHAIGIDNMMTFADNDKGHFTITNSEDYRQFIQVAMSKVTTQDGQLVKTPLTRNNLPDWDIAVRPARTVIDPRLQKNFEVSYQPKVGADKTKDHMYQVTFVPTPYFAKGEANKQALQVAVGFAPYFIVPAEKDAPFNYEMSFKGKTFHLHNYADTYLHAVLDTCSTGTVGKTREDCNKVIYTLAGRDLNVSLPKNMQGVDSIKVSLSTHHMTYKDDITLKSGQLLSTHKGTK